MGMSYDDIMHDKYYDEMMQAQQDEWLDEQLRELKLSSHHDAIFDALNEEYENKEEIFEALIHELDNSLKGNCYLGSLIMSGIVLEIFLRDIFVYPILKGILNDQAETSRRLTSLIEEFIKMFFRKLDYHTLSATFAESHEAFEVFEKSFIKNFSDNQKKLVEKLDENLKKLSYGNILETLKSYRNAIVHGKKIVKNNDLCLFYINSTFSIIEGILEILKKDYEFDSVSPSTMVVIQKYGWK